MTPLQAIRANCLECNNTAYQVKHCACTNCPMYPFRFGKNPNAKRKLTDEQKERAVENLRLAREKKG